MSVSQTAQAAEPAPFRPLEDADVLDFRVALAELRRAGYSEPGVRERLGVADLGDIRWKERPMYQAERLSHRDPLALAIELFLLQGPVTAHELDDLLSAASQEVLLRSGILAIDSKGIWRARASLFPAGNRLIFSDHAWPKLPHPGLKKVPSNQVMSIGRDSRALSRATIRQPVGAALDLCTGSGIHALLAASHAARVVAVDINPRAVDCTRFNAQALGAGNVEALEGDLFEPLGPDGKFDLITANPPFVPSPVDEFTFRDGGRSGEEVQRRVIEGLPHFLAPGGTAQMITEFGEREGEPLTDRLREWLSGAPFDIHVIRLGTHSTADYSIGHANGDKDFGAYLDSVGAWAANLRAHGYQRIVSVLLTFQWSDPALGRPWDRVDESRAPAREAGAEIEAIFARERRARGPERASGSVRRAGPIALTQSQVSGTDIRAGSHATLMGKALSIGHPLDAFECEVLEGLENSVSIPDLLAIARQCTMSEPALLAALRSLEQKGLVVIE